MIRFLVMLLIALFSLSTAHAGNRSQPANLSASTSTDPTNQFTVYSYQLSNPSSNTAPLDTLTVTIPPGVDTVSSISSPTGWRAFYSPEQGTLMWAAVGYINGDAQDDSDEIPQSDYVIQSGASLSGFSFKAYSRPGSVNAFVQSYAPLGVIGEDDDDPTDIAQSTLPDQNGYMTTTTGPLPVPTWDGNRRPAVDGFLVFVNVEPRTTFQGSALILFRLGSAGEQVDAASMRIDLNGSDVSNDFVFLPEFNGYVAIFAPGSSPVTVGSNVLKTSIKGIEPGGTKWLVDSDRLVFELIQ